MDIAKHFGTYVLPGRIKDPNKGFAEARDAEDIGLGSIWLSERYGLKEVGVTCGALSQVTSNARIFGTFYCNIRHPIITASIANELQHITSGRFGFLLAKGVPEFLRDLGLPNINFEMLKDFIEITKTLWHGESLSYSGILGDYPSLRLTDFSDVPPPPIYITAIGPKSLDFAGRYCDGVLLHPLLTPEGVEKSSAIVRSAAEKTGRDPKNITVCANVLVAPDLPENEFESIIGGRAITYLQAPTLGAAIIRANNWDPSILEKIKGHHSLAQLNGKLADQEFRKEELIGVAKSIPDAWIKDGTASGSAESCAKKLLDYISAGADHIVLHGSAPNKMRNTIALLR